MGNFLTTDDYNVFIKQDILAEILANSDTSQNAAEMRAQSQIESYLKPRYDVVQIFTTYGDDRNYDIVTKMTHIVLYILHKPLTPNQVPKHIIDDYTETIRWLEHVRQLKLSPDLPLLEVDDNGDDTQIVFDSNCKRHNQF